MKTKIINLYKKIIDVIEIYVKILCQLLLVSIVIVGFMGILTRYLPVSQPIWLGQMAVFLGVWMYFLGFILTAKNEDYIFIDFLHSRLPLLCQKLLSIFFHIIMIIFCIVVIIGGLPLQRIQSRMMVTSFPLPQNFFSMPVLISMIFVTIILIYHTFVRLIDIVKILRKNSN